MQAAISKTYIACNMTEPDTNGMAAKIGVCLEDLSEIPTLALDAVFRTARQRKAGFFPSTGELLMAWMDVKAEHNRKVEASKRQQNALPEHYDADMARDARLYVIDRTPERLKKLQEKYPSAGF